MKLQIEIELSELLAFISNCSNGDDYNFNACNSCPVRKECHYYYTKNKNGSALDNINYQRKEN